MELQKIWNVKVKIILLVLGSLGAILKQFGNRLKQIGITAETAQVQKTVLLFFFFSIWVFFHEHSRFTGQQGKGEGIYLTPLYHFHPLHRHLDISRAITAESSPLHIASSRTRNGNLWFPSASR